MSNLVNGFKIPIYLTNCSTASVRERCVKCDAGTTVIIGGSYRGGTYVGGTITTIGLSQNGSSILYAQGVGITDCATTVEGTISTMPQYFLF